MSGRNHGPPIPMKGGGGMPIHEPPYGRNLGTMPPHPSLLEKLRESQFGMGPPRQLPPHNPAILEERMATQHQDTQVLLVDNQRLAATHVALKQELEAVQHELQRTDHIARAMHAEKDMQARELYDKSVKMETDLREVKAMSNELMQLNAEIQELTAARHKLTVQVQAMTQDFARATAELQKVPAVKAEIDGLKQELHRARAAIEHEKKGYAENYEHGQALEKNLISMARELEKLRAEMANAEKRAHAAAAVANTGAGYNGNYGNPEAAYSGNPYPANYGMNPINPAQVGAENFAQYGPGPGPGSWGAYDMQRAQGHR